MTTSDLARELGDLLAGVLGHPVAVDGLQRLTGGASRETWAFRAGDEDLILRRDPPGRPGAPGAMRLEADLMRACRAAGLRVPDVVLDDDGDRLGGAGLVMRRVDGETIPRRILRDDRFAAARAQVVPDVARFLAGLHALDPDDVSGLQAQDPLRVMRAAYDAAGVVSRTFERAYEWLVANRPSPSGPPAIVHGDLRLGNLVVDERGLAAVLDWELSHVGDPLEDLAWLCVRAWRFGAAPEAAGLASVDELVAAYEDAGGRPVDRDALRWWLVERTLAWGVICIVQAGAHLAGHVRSVELATVGRRVAEQEWDLLELVAPDAWRAARDAPPPATLADGDAGYGRPTARELLEAVREFLTDQVVTSGDRRLAFGGRVAANAIAIVERELAQARVDRDGDGWETLALEVRDRLTVANPRHL